MYKRIADYIMQQLKFVDAKEKGSSGNLLKKKFFFNCSEQHD